jgi:hypothetical protein
MSPHPTQDMVSLSRGRDHSRFGVESAIEEHASARRRGQAEMGLTAPHSGDEARILDAVEVDRVITSPRQEFLISRGDN